MANRDLAKESGGLLDGGWGKGPLSIRLIEACLPCRRFLEGAFQKVFLHTREALCRAWSYNHINSKV